MTGTPPTPPTPTPPVPVGSPQTLFESSGARALLDELDAELIGLAPVKSRIRDIAALLVVDKLRAEQGLQSRPPGLHMSFTGNPGTGKTTVAMRMATVLRQLGYVRRGHLVAVTRDDLVGQYIGHTAPKTRDVIKRAMGGVLFIDEAYYLYRPENERDYGQESIEILLQVMENQRDDLVVILAGYKNRMDTFFMSNPGMSSRIAHHIDFPDFSETELVDIARLMLRQLNYGFDAEAELAFREYVHRRRLQPHFANARSIRNGLDRMRLRHATRLFASHSALTRDDLCTLCAVDVRTSRVFAFATSDDAAAPQANVLLADAPFADAPFAEAPFAEAPFADAPLADAPLADAPFADVSQSVR